MNFEKYDETKELEPGYYLCLKPLKCNGHIYQVPCVYYYYKKGSVRVASFIAGKSIIIKPETGKTGPNGCKYDELCFIDSGFYNHSPGIETYTWVYNITHYCRLPDECFEGYDRSTNQFEFEETARITGEFEHVKPELWYTIGTK